MTEGRVIWRHNMDPHTNAELLRPPKGEGLFVLEVYYYGDQSSIYLSEDALAGLSGAIQAELVRRHTRRSEE